MRRPLIVLVLCWGLCGCGSAPESPPTMRTTPSPEATVTDPTPTSPTGGVHGSATVTGVLADGVEQGCLLLETGRETLQLVGARVGPLRAGDRVTVTGTRSPGLMTTCQQGVPFQVGDLRPAAD